MSRKLFKAQIGNEGSDNWPIAWTGQDDKGNHCQVTTNQVHASELADFSKGAAGDAELIASLLQLYYSDEDIRAKINGQAQ